VKSVISYLPSRALFSLSARALFWRECGWRITDFTDHTYRRIGPCAAAMRSDCDNPALA
jgi:hypothetical protein